jgi:peptidoglycan/xylan/chitin deacetylase (PgdA/CDA1 family)
MSTRGHIFVPPGSRIAGFAEALSWLWRLGPLLDSPQPDAVGLGWLEEARELRALLDAGRLGGAAVFATRPGPGDGSMPSRGWVSGVASFGRGRRVTGQFCMLHGGTPALRSSLGVHAVRDGRWLVLGADPDSSWGTLATFWVLPALADFLVDVLSRPLVMLPALGWVRYDDLPGTAYHQVSGRDKPDEKVRRRVEAAVKLFAENGARLNIAIPSRAFVDRSEVGVDEVWPGAVAAIRRGIDDGVVEPVCHGYLHLDTDDWAHGEVNPREFKAVDRTEAGRRIDVSLSWFEGVLGVRPQTFVAPTWAYSEGLIAALADRELPAWLPPLPAPLIADGNGRETISSGMEGLFRLDYGPFGALAEAGLPPSIVIHGGLFDMRDEHLRRLSEAPTTARLVMRRDLFRFPWVPGVRWIGARELLDRLRGHNQIAVEGDEISNPAGFEVAVRDRFGGRLFSG